MCAARSFCLHLNLRRFDSSLLLLVVGAKTFRTKTKDSTLDPVWNEVFEVSILFYKIITAINSYLWLPQIFLGIFFMNILDIIVIEGVNRVDCLSLKNDSLLAEALQNNNNNYLLTVYHIKEN